MIRNRLRDDVVLSLTDEYFTTRYLLARRFTTEGNMLKSHTVFSFVCFFDLCFFLQKMTLNYSTADNSTII